MNNDHELLKSYLKDWTIERVLGQGSFGKVYEISRNDNGTIYRAALKVISIPQSNAEVEDLTKEGNTEDQVKSYLKGVVDDIKRENAIMSQLKGRTNIVSYEHHEVHPHEDGLGWDIVIRMELLTPLMDYLLGKESGEGHVQEIKYGNDKVMKLYENDIIRLGIDICHALEICNAKNIIHRDIKPENIFVNDDGDFKLGDFGIARSISEGTLSDMTRTGTPSYMAPEVYQNSLKYDKSVDTYSLGIVLYKLLNHNRLPFSPAYPAPVTAAAKVESVTRRVNGHELPKPDGCKNGDLIKTILKACSFKPEDRFKNPEDMRRALESILRGETPDFLKEDLKKDDHNPFTDLTVNVTNTGSTIPEIHTHDDENGHDKKVKSKGTAKKLLFILIPVIAVIGIAATAFLFRPWESKEENPAANTNGPAEILPNEECKHENLEYIHISDKTYISALEYTQNRTPVCLDCDTELPVEKIDSSEEKDFFEAYGECGNNLFWNLTKDGMLYIGGAGEMIAGEDPYVTPWSDVRDKIKSVRIGDGITNIMPFAFYMCRNLESITIPETVIKIDEAALANTALKKLHIPGSVTSLMDNSLVYCYDLEEITVSEDNANFTSVDGILYTKSMKTLCLYPIAKQEADYMLPKTVEGITPMALTSANITEVNVEKGNNYFTSIDGVLYAYAEENSKYNIVLVYYPTARKEAGLTLSTSVVGIASYAFADCKNIRSLIIPDSVINFGESVFANCDNLTIYCSTVSGASSYAKLMNLKVAYPSTEAAEFRSGLEWQMYNDGTLYLSGKGCIPNWQSDYSSDDDSAPWIQAFNNKVTKVIIGNGITSIGDNSFKEYYVTEIEIPESVIHFESLVSFSNLEHFSISPKNKVFALNEHGMLYNKMSNTLIRCPKDFEQKEYTVPEEICKIEYHAFYNVYMLEKITFKNPDIEMSSYAIADCGEITLCGYADSKAEAWYYSKKKDYEAGSNKNVLKFESLGKAPETDPTKCGPNATWEFDIADGLLTISGTGTINSAPWQKYNDGIKTVIIKDGITSICSYAFSSSNIENAIIADSVIYISNSAFWNCDQLKSIALSKNLIFIGNSAFNYCSELENIELPDTVVHVGKEAFSYCKKLKGIKLSKNMGSIEEKTFQNCDDLKEVIIPDSVSYIAPYAFYFSGLESVTLPAGITDIKDAFAFSELKTISVSSYDDTFCSIDGVLFSKDKKTLVLYPSNRDEDSYTVPSSVTSISENAFSNCKNKTITIGSGVTSLDQSAFYSCDNINVIISEGLRSLDKNVFSYCDYLTVTIPASVTTINDSLFNGCEYVSVNYQYGSAAEKFLKKLGWI